MSVEPQNPATTFEGRSPFAGSCGQLIKHGSLKQHTVCDFEWGRAYLLLVPAIQWRHCLRNAITVLAILRSKYSQTLERERHRDEGRKFKKNGIQKEKFRANRHKKGSDIKIDGFYLCTHWQLLKLRESHEYHNKPLQLYLLVTYCGLDGRGSNFGTDLRTVSLYSSCFILEITRHNLQSCSL